jgi:sugar O-acyltransferase (sialic acid O-acetyltransferase NeuD family)
MNTITLIGFPQATLTNEIRNIMSINHDINILHPDDFFKGNYQAGTKFMVTVTLDRELRKKLMTELDQQKLPRASYIHPSAIVDSTAVVEDGTFVGPFSSVFFQAQVGKDCIIGPYSMISHRSALGAGSIVHPGVIVAGSTKIGEHCLLNLRSTVIDKLEICNDVIIGAGSLITKDITVSGNYVGSPARKIS